MFSFFIESKSDKPLKQEDQWLHVLTEGPIGRKIYSFLTDEDISKLSCVNKKLKQFCEEDLKEQHEEYLAQEIYQTLNREIKAVFRSTKCWAASLCCTCLTSSTSVILLCFSPLIWPDNKVPLVVLLLLAFASSFALVKLDKNPPDRSLERIAANRIFENRRNHAAIEDKKSSDIDLEAGNYQPLIDIKDLQKLCRDEQNIIEDEKAQKIILKAGFSDDLAEKRILCNLFNQLSESANHPARAEVSARTSWITIKNIDRQKLREIVGWNEPSPSAKNIRR